MKRTFAKLLSLFVVLTLVIAMVPAVFAVGEKVSAGKNTLSVNKSTTVSVTDANGTAVPTVTLSSDHDDIVSVLDSSTIKALKVGSATITATVTAEDKTVQTLGSVQITVQSGVSAITPDTSYIEIDADNEKTASLSVTLTGAASGDVLAVQSSDESVVTAQAGAITLPGGSCSVTLTAVKTGTAAVTLSCGTATAQVAVTVKATKDHTVTFEKQKLTVEKAKTATNTATKATDGDKLTYASSTAVDYSKDQFYLSGTSAKNLYLDSVFFLPAADCSTQIRLAFTVYGTSGTQLGSGELTVRVASKTASSVFSDVNARTCSWAANAVDFMNEYGLVKGTGTSTFGWKGSMTRGDFVLILYRNAGSPSVYGVSNPFTDVKSTDYYYEAVLWAYRNNVVNGTSTTTFGPKGKITREQIASILWRLAGKPVYSASLRSYTDYASVSDYAYDAMSWAVGSGYVKGSGAKLSPKNNATRAEVAVMLHRYLTK